MAYTCMHTVRCTCVYVICALSILNWPTKRRLTNIIYRFETRKKWWSDWGTKIWKPTANKRIMSTREILDENWLHYSLATWKTWNTLKLHATIIIIITYYYCCAVAVIRSAFCLVGFSSFSFVGMIIFASPVDIPI